MSFLTVLSAIPWRFVIPIAAIILALVFILGFRGCARITRASEGTNLEQIKDALLSPSTDYDRL